MEPREPLPAQMALRERIESAICATSGLQGLDVLVLLAHMTGQLTEVLIALGHARADVWAVVNANLEQGVVDVVCDGRPVDGSGVAG
jgi:hypothetical protein